MNLPPQIKELIDALSDVKSTAALSAMAVMQANFAKLLVSKGVISQADIIALVAQVELAALSKRTEAPEFSAALLQVCLDFRHGFEEGAPRRAS